MGRRCDVVPDPLAPGRAAVVEFVRELAERRLGSVLGDSLSRSGMREGDAACWVLADAVVLATARLSGTTEQPAGLHELIANADAVFHLIPSAAEIEAALGRLLGADLITVGEQGMIVAPLGRELVARSRGGSRGDSMARVRSLLALLEDVPTDPVPWHLDREVYEAVTLEYRHSLWETFRARRGRSF